MQSAKDVANSTAQLVKEIKALDLDYSEANRRKCAVATKPLLGKFYQQPCCCVIGSPRTGLKICYVLLFSNFFYLQNVIVLDAVDNLCMFASSSEFTSVPAKISPQARKAQEPIVEAGRQIIDSSCTVISTAKSLVVMPKDPPTWQQFASNSKNVSDSIKKLVNSIR